MAIPQKTTFASGFHSPEKEEIIPVPELNKKAKKKNPLQ